MRIHIASSPRLLSALVGLFLLAALWSAPGAFAQVSLPSTDDVESQVKGATDQVEEAVDEVKDTVEGAGEAVKGAVQDPVGTVQGATNTVTGTVEGAQEQSGGTTTAGSAGTVFVRWARGVRGSGGLLEGPGR